jgi:ribose transport system permease protein
MDITCESKDEKNLQIQMELDKKAKRTRIIGNVLPFTGLAFITIFFLVVTKGVLINPSNLENLLNQCFTLTIISVGASFVYAHGGFDFSLGASCGLAQLVGAALLVYTDTPIWLAITLCILTAVTCSAIVGGSSLLFGVPVFVASLCVRSIAIGILSTATSETEIILNYGKYQYISNTGVKAVVLLAIVAAGFFMFEYTRLGKYEKAIGGNILTAQQAGVKTGRNIFIAYIILGICVGIAATFTMFRTSLISAQTGSGLEFDVMTAIVLGGFPLTGGDRSKIQSTIIGVMTVTILSNGLILWGLDPSLINGIKGILFLVIVGLSYDRSNGKIVS